MTFKFPSSARAIIYLTHPPGRVYGSPSSGVHNETSECQTPKLLRYQETRLSFRFFPAKSVCGICAEWRNEVVFRHRLQRYRRWAIINRPDFPHALNCEEDY